MSAKIDGNYGVNAYASQVAATNTKTEEAVEKAAAEESKKTNQDEFVKAPTYKPDLEKVAQMKADLKGNVSAFRGMVQSLIQKQGGFAESAAGFSLKNLFENLKVDEATRLEAQQAISEDGEWGVEAVANRLVDFAKAISGGNPEKIELLRKAVQDGFKAAEKVWGGKLPDISQKTYDRTMELFDEWANGDVAEPEAEAAE